MHLAILAKLRKYSSSDDDDDNKFEVWFELNSKPYIDGHQMYHKSM